MRHYNLDGTVAKSTAYPASFIGISESDAKDPKRLSEVLRELQGRMGALESKGPPESIEYVLDVGAGGAITRVYHGLSSSIRWYITTWVGPAGAYILVQDESSDTNYLALRSYASGRIVLRIEPSQHGVS